MGSSGEVGVGDAQAVQAQFEAKGKKTDES